MAAHQDPSGATRRSTYVALFDELSAGGSTLDADQLWFGIRKMKLPVMRCQVRQLVREADLSQRGYVTRDEFVALLEAHESMLHDAFRAADVDGKGALSLEHLAVAMERAGVPCTRRQAARAMRRLDTNRDGVVQYDEWVHMAWLLMPYNNPEHAYKLFLKLDGGFKWWHTVPAGVISGVASRTAMAPLDRAKLLMQVGTSAHAQEPRVAGILRSMYRTDGMRGLFTGNGTACLQAGLGSCLTFFCYYQFKGLVCDDPAMPTFREKVVLGAIGGTVSTSLLYPLATIQARVAVSEVGQFSSTWDAVRQLHIEQGARGIYRGYVAALMRAAPFSGIQMSTYNLLKEKFLHDDQRPSMVQSLAMGSAATALAVVATYPLDTIGVTLRTQGLEAEPIQYPNIRTALRGLYREGGVRRFYDGLVPALKHVPALSIGYVVYESVLTLMRWWDSPGGGESRARAKWDAWKRWEERQQHLH